MKKLLRKIVAICSLLAVALTVCNVKVNAEDIKKTWISFIGNTLASECAYFVEGGVNEHDYEFMIGTSSSYADVTAVIINMPSEDYLQVSIINEATGRKEKNYAYSQYEDKMIYYIAKPEKTTKYLIKIRNLCEDNYNKVYSVMVDTIYKRGTYKAKFRPSTLKNPGKGRVVNMNAVYSNVGTLDLRKDTTIPDSAEVTNVSVTGTMSRRLGGTKMELTNGDSGVKCESLLVDSGKESVLFNDFRNSFDTVKTIWSVDYYTYAGASSTFSNTEISITYRYNKYADF